MTNTKHARAPFSIQVPYKLIADLLSHFGPDPVTRGWCVKADFGVRLPYVVEVLDESKELAGGNLKNHYLTNRVLRDGLRAMAKKHPDHIGSVMDEDKHDAALADLFVQCCLFGEEKYA